MESKLNPIDFEICTNAMEQELSLQIQHINSIELELLRKFEGSLHLTESHPELIFYLRNTVSHIQEAYKDVESYLRDLKIPFLFEFFRKMQVLMVTGYNFMSQALLTHIDISQEHARQKKVAKLEPFKQVVVETPKEEDQVLDRGRQRQKKAREMERFEYEIRYLEREEEKISCEMHKLIDTLMLSKGLVDKLVPSMASKQIEEIKQRNEISLEQGEKIFEEAYQLKYAEFKEQMAVIQRPDEVARAFTKDIKGCIKEKFSEGIQRSAVMLQEIIRKDELSRMTDADTQTQVEKPPPPEKVEKKKVNHTKQKKLQEDLTMSRRQLAKTRQDKDVLGERYRTLEAAHKELNLSYSTLQSMYDEKRQAVERLQADGRAKDKRIAEWQGHRCDLPVKILIDQHAQTKIVKYAENVVQTPDEWKYGMTKSSRNRKKLASHDFFGQDQSNQRKNRRKKILSGAMSVTMQEFPMTNSSIAEESIQDEDDVEINNRLSLPTDRDSLEESETNLYQPPSGDDRLYKAKHAKRKVSVDLGKFAKKFLNITTRFMEQDVQTDPFDLFSSVEKKDQTITPQKRESQASEKVKQTTEYSTQTDFKHQTNSPKKKQSTRATFESPQLGSNKSRFSKKDLLSKPQSRFHKSSDGKRSPAPGLPHLSSKKSSEVNIVEAPIEPFQEEPSMQRGHFEALNFNTDQNLTQTNQRMIARASQQQMSLIIKKRREKNSQKNTLKQQNREEAFRSQRESRNSKNSMFWVDRMSLLRDIKNEGEAVPQDNLEQPKTQKALACVKESEDSIHT